MPVFLAPLLSKFGGYALVALALVIGLAVAYGKGRADQSGIDKGANAAAILQAQKKADDLADQLIRTENAARDATAKTVTVFRDRIINAPSTNTCGPSVLAALDGLRTVLGTSGAASK